MTTMAPAADPAPVATGADVTSGRVAAGDASLYFEVRGRQDAPWITLLHSLATDSRLWAPQLAALAADWRLLSIDLRGHGQSLCDGRPATIGDLAGDVVAVWDALGVTRTAVVGLSIGGMTALSLGLDHPDRVDRIVAADCRADAPGFFHDMWVQRRAAVEAGGMEAVVDATLASWLTPQTRQERPDLVETVRGMIAATTLQGYAAATHALMHLDEKRRLGAMTRPVLFVCGAEDGLHPAEMRAMAALTPGCAFAEIAGASHLSNLEQPDAFASAVRGWLA